MLRQLSSSNDDRFKTLEFGPGLNLVVAEKTQDASDTDTRNGAGKSSIVELLHFLLGGRVDANSLVTRSPLRESRFRLILDWPSVAPPGLSVQRSGKSPNDILLDPDVTGNAAFTLDVASTRISLADWQVLLESVLYGLPVEHSGISGRAMLSLYMRRVRSHAFNEPTKTHPQQSQSEATANIAYLLGLDWKLASQYRELSAREATRRRLAEAARDPVWGRIVGRSAELRGQISNVQQRVEELESQVRSFEIVPQYEALQRQADELGQRIRAARLEDATDRANLRDYEDSIASVKEPDTNYLQKTYSNLGLILSDAVIRRFDEVQDFHRTVVDNRKQYLQDEINAIASRLEERVRLREVLGNEQSAILQRLSAGGALESLNVLQQQLARERAELESLRNRYEAALALESSRAEIRAERGRLETEVRTDLAERDQQINYVSLLFLQFARELYGADRQAYLSFDPTETHLKITPYIDSEASQGIGKMVTFCLDLTVAVVAHRAGRGPDFLVHDSHLFDGVDERQVARALRLAKQTCEQEGLQYIATINSDDLERVVAQGIDLSPSALEVKLTDAYEDGGVFGFRFS